MVNDIFEDFFDRHEYQEDRDEVTIDEEIEKRKKQNAKDFDYLFCLYPAVDKWDGTRTYERLPRLRTYLESSQVVEDYSEIELISHDTNVVEMYATKQFGFAVDYEEHEGFCQMYGLTVRFAVNLRRDNPIAVLRFVTGLLNVYRNKPSRDPWGSTNSYNNMRIFTGKRLTYKVDTNESRTSVYVYGWNVYQSFGLFAVGALMKIFRFDDGPIAEDQYFAIKQLARFLLFDRLPVCRALDKLTDLTKRCTFKYKDTQFIANVSGQDNPDRYTYPSVSAELDDFLRKVRITPDMLKLPFRYMKFINAFTGRKAIVNNYTDVTHKDVLDAVEDALTNEERYVTTYTLVCPKSTNSVMFAFTTGPFVCKNCEYELFVGFYQKPSQTKADFYEMAKQMLGVPEDMLRKVLES